MNTTRTITLRVEKDEYDRLEALAQRRRLPVSALAQGYVRAGLENDQPEAALKQKSEALEAIESLAVLRAELRRGGYPSIDALELVRAGRAELEERAG